MKASKPFSAKIDVGHCVSCKHLLPVQVIHYKNGTYNIKRRMSGEIIYATPAYQGGKFVGVIFCCAPCAKIKKINTENMIEV